MRKVFFLSFLSAFYFLCADAQKSYPEVQVLTSGTKTSIRGLSVVNDQVVWVSGSNGTVGRSSNGGKDWKWMVVKGFDSVDFRDIYEDRRKGMFLDAMEFWNEKAGIIIGDPMDGRFFILRSFDGGNSWREIPLENRPVADSGEACYAAS
jgi:photosystem II stability/assembly factor-like uncharacterized protein